MHAFILKRNAYLTINGKRRVCRFNTREKQKDNITLMYPAHSHIHEFMDERFASSMENYGSVCCNIRELHIMCFCNMTITFSLCQIRIL